MINKKPFIFTGEIVDDEDMSLSNIFVEHRFDKGNDEK